MIELLRLAASYVESCSQVTITQPFQHLERPMVCRKLYLPHLGEKSLQLDHLVADARYVVADQRSGRRVRLGRGGAAEWEYEFHPYVARPPAFYLELQFTNNSPVSIANPEATVLLASADEPTALRYLVLLNETCVAWRAFSSLGAAAQATRDEFPQRSFDTFTFERIEDDGTLTEVGDDELAPWRW